MRLRKSPTAHMSRWQFPFKSREEANRFLEQASHDTGKKAFVKKVTYEVSIYKIFPSINDWRRYAAKKAVQFKR